MTDSSRNPILDRAREVERDVLHHVYEARHTVTVVESPPGAGKTRLTESLVATGALHFDRRIAVAVPRAEQSFDLIRRLSDSFPGLDVRVLQSRTRQLPADVSARINVGTPQSNQAALRGGGAHVVVGTVAKFVTAIDRMIPGEFDALVCDEAYQVPAKDFDPLVSIATQSILVGDPGQLPPLVRTDTARFEAARYRVHRPAPSELVRRHHEIPIEKLPATFRFPEDSVRFIQPSFYPELPFESAASDADRRLTFATAGMGNEIDRALDMIADGASIACILLPEKPTGQGEIDLEVSAVMARVAHRALQRGMTWPGRGALGPGDIGCIDSHVASGAEVRRQLLASGCSPELVVETPEIWQGLQRPLMIVKHSLSGLTRVDPFALEPGRTCVMLSRHMLGCVIVGREGVGEALDRYQHDSGARPTGTDDTIWAGWQAQQTLWQELERRDRFVRIERLARAS